MAFEKFRLGVAQITSTDQTDFNLRQVEDLYSQAANEHAQLVVFPENTLFFRIQSGAAVKGLAWGGPEMVRLQKLVDGSGARLMLTTAFNEAGGKVSNSTVLFQKAMAAEKLYSKIHLFDVDVAGAPPVRESEHFTRGSEPKMLELDGWKIGLTICYDLRFAELYLRYAQKVDLILVPAAFLVPTGEAHWHVLLRARAIETQAYVAAPAQSGEHRSAAQVRKTFGHSLVVDPWGRIVAELEESPRIRVVELDRAQIEKARAQIPMAGHRRL
jgi:deaminated glutathione amidase